MNDHQVEYLVVGGVAVGYHGYPRTTGDLDVWIARHRQNARRIVAALKDFGFGASRLTQAMFLKRNAIIRMGHPPLRIEILTSISGVEFADCHAERIVSDFDGVEVNVINLEHLKRNKRASGRAKDLADLENLP